MDKTAETQETQETQESKNSLQKPQIMILYRYIHEEIHMLKSICEWEKIVSQKDNVWTNDQEVHCLIIWRKKSMPI